MLKAYLLAMTEKALSKITQLRDIDSIYGQGEKMHYLRKICEYWQSYDTFFEDESQDFIELCNSINAEFFQSVFTGPVPKDYKHGLMELVDSHKPESLCNAPEGSDLLQICEICNKDERYCQGHM